MNHLIFQGFAFGLLLAILIGPVFFALIQTSIKRGFSAGLSFAIGIFLSDLTCIFLSNLGVSQITYDNKYKIIIGVVGGILMIVFGVYEYFHKEKTHKELDIENIPPKKIIYILKSYFLNIANPFVLIFWLTASTKINAEYSDSIIDVITFFSATLLTAFFTDTLKAFFASRIKSILTDEILRKVHKVAGVLLVLFGIALMLRVLIK